MMRGPEKLAIAVRNPAGQIILKTEELLSQKSRSKILKWPFIRGVVNFGSSMVCGVKSLMYSAEIAMPDETEEALAPNSGEGADIAAADLADTPEFAEAQEAEAHAEAIFAETQAETPSAAPSEEPTVKADSKSADAAEKKKSAQEKAVVIGSVVLGTGLSVVLFMLLPTVIASLFSGLTESRILRNLIEGVIRIVIFLGYISLTSLISDMRRVWMYHGAEHKTIFCYEKGLPLTVDNCREMPRCHPRCGTSFMFIVMIISILVFSVVSWNGVLQRILLRLILLPVVVAISYEIIKLAGRYDNIFTRIVSAPGKALQRLTTREPDDSMLEVAIAALEAVKPAERGADLW
ncbi:MAG: DUF1385 domain-containing protein [Oscillospiraceae bacterium]|jgi:uncharacterized protein YqhQ|nr:DUF1385 domain-containing protein [Oscillospiraceae bacterium]